MGKRPVAKWCIAAFTAAWGVRAVWLACLPVDASAADRALLAAYGAGLFGAGLVCAVRPVFARPLACIALGLIACEHGAALLQAAQPRPSLAVSGAAITFVCGALTYLLRRPPALPNTAPAGEPAAETGTAPATAADEGAATLSARDLDRDLFPRLLAWQQVLNSQPADAEACLCRALYDADWRPNREARRALAAGLKHVESETVRRLANQRAELIPRLIAAAGGPQSAFHDLAGRILSRVTGEEFDGGGAEAWTGWWEKAGPEWSDDAGMVAAVARLLRLRLPAAACALARRVAGRAEEPLLREFAAQVSFLHEMRTALHDRERIEPVIRQAKRILLVPALADSLGLLHADSEYLARSGVSPAALARRLPLRTQVVDYAVRLWQRYPAELNADMPWIIRMLANARSEALNTPEAFGKWWSGARQALRHHGQSLAAGLAAHGAGDMAGAETAFRKALAAQPHDLSVRYNLVLCALQRKDDAQAVRLLKELAGLEPKEPYWWVMLAQVHQRSDRREEAHAAVHRAIKLGAVERRVALHLGLTLAHDCREDEAIAHFDRALGANPSVEKIESLASHLESEGLWKLAGHYREKALRRGLGDDSAPA
jgi:tetratricopeptide (TPR) repeat protein